MDTALAGSYSPVNELTVLFRLRPSHHREIYFGFLLRLVIAVVAVIVPAVILLVVGFFNGWQLTNSLLYFYGGFTGTTILFGEHLRSRAYERVIFPQAVGQEIEDFPF